MIPGFIAPLQTMLLDKRAEKFWQLNRFCKNGAITGATIGLQSAKSGPTST